MKIKMDMKNINSLSSSFIEGYILDEEMEEKINQLKQQLLNGNNSCILISGYRGTGKTTLVNKLENDIRDDIKDDRMLFIHLNFNKYEEYTFILRKLIREMYLTFSSNKNYEEIKKDDVNLIDRFELLYDHTFYEVNNSSTTKNIKELISKIEVNFNIKYIIKYLLPIIAVIFSNININYNILHIPLKSINIIIFAISCIWLLITPIFSLQHLRKKTFDEELIRKSLYDDEIAEYHLNNILKELRDKGIKAIFVFDELDKIDDDEEIEIIISDLKPILLSNLASFILISGQQLYYKFINSSVLDDSVISSIFSKTIHVPLTSNISFEKLFRNYIIDKNQLEEDKVKYYIDSLILNSNRTVRRFINLILQDIIWEEGLPYLYIYDEKQETYKTDSIILSILTNIVDSEIEDKDYDNGVNDFFTYQLFIWVKKMKLKGKVPFTISEIINFEESYTKNYPFWCKIQLNELCKSFVRYLLKEKLLEVLEIGKEVEGEIEHLHFKWTNSANIKLEGISNDLVQIKVRFLENIMTLEKYCCDIYMDLNKNESSINLESGFDLTDTVDKLVSAGVLGEEWKSVERKELYILGNKVKLNKELNDYETNMLQKYTYTINQLISNMIEEYSYYVINDYLKKHWFNTICEKNSKTIDDRFIRFDMIAESNFNKRFNIVFEILYRNNISNSNINNIHRLLKDFKNYNDITRKANKLAIFWFSKENKQAYNRFKITLTKILNSEYKDLDENVYTFYVPSRKLARKTIETYLNSILNPSSNIRNELNSNIALTEIDNIDSY